MIIHLALCMVLHLVIIYLFGQAPLFLVILVTRIVWIQAVVASASPIRLTPATSVLGVFVRNKVENLII